MHDARMGMRRREFINAAAAGAVALAFAPPSEAKAKSRVLARAPAPKGPSSIYVCDTCGHVEFSSPPEFCPVCHTEERFAAKDTIFSEAMAKAKDGGAEHTPILHVQQKSALVPDVPCKEVLIRVGQTMHEVEQADHIHFIDCYLDGKFFTRFFASPHMQPAVVLFVKAPASKIRAVSYCNRHGFWQAETPL